MKAASNRRPRRARACSALALAGSCLGCGAGTPILHPAHPLGEGQVAATSGFSAHFTSAEAQRAIDDASAQAVSGRTDDADKMVTGALGQTLSTPGLAPWLSVRAGVGQDSEAGLAYTGRRARVDFRYALVLDQTAFSFGAGITGIMPDVGAYPPRDPCTDPELCPEPIVNDSYSEIPGLDTGSVSGFGVDLPLLVGWRSQPGLFSLWGGIRARYEDMQGELRFDTEAGARTARASGSRVAFQGIIGLAVGLKPIWAALEISPAFEQLRGDVELESGSVGAVLEGFAFSPAIALMYAP